MHFTSLTETITFTSPNGTMYVATGTWGHDGDTFLAWALLDSVGGVVAEGMDHCGLAAAVSSWLVNGGLSILGYENSHVGVRPGKCSRCNCESYVRDVKSRYTTNAVCIQCVPLI